MGGCDNYLVPTSTSPQLFEGPHPNAVHLEVLCPFSSRRVFMNILNGGRGGTTLFLVYFPVIGQLLFKIDDLDEIGLLLSGVHEDVQNETMPKLFLGERYVGSRIWIFPGMG